MLIYLMLPVHIVTIVLDEPMNMYWKCYCTKLGSAHLCAVKPSYWHQLVVKESAAFIADAKQGVQGS